MDNIDLNDKICGTQMRLMIDIAQSIALFHVINPIVDGGIRNQAFWVHLNNIAINDACIIWCKIFGTDSNEVHWKKADSDGKHIDAVRYSIISVFNDDPDSWKNYRKTVIDFRDTYSAHRNLNESVPVPLTESMLKVAEAYFNFIVNAKAPWNGTQPYLNKYYRQHSVLISRKVILDKCLTFILRPFPKKLG